MSLEICTSHFNEDLTWLEKSIWPVSIIHHEGGTHIDYTYIIPNIGFEVTSYLKYIIERYDSLPEHVAFIHGHENDWHQLGDRPMLDMIRDANIQKYDYVPLNNCWRCVQSEMQCIEESEFAKNNNLPNMSPFFITCCGGQFIVSKKSILKNSKSDYEAWYSLVNTKSNAIYFELYWHVIFGCNDSIVPFVDNFTPSLKEILYHPSCCIPMICYKFKPCFMGSITSLNIIHITNQAEYEYYNIRAGTFFVNTDDKCYIKLKIDYGKLILIQHFDYIKQIILIFQKIAYEQSSIDNELHV